MEFWAQIKPNKHEDLMLYWSQTCLRHVLEFGIWQYTPLRTKLSKSYRIWYGFWKMGKSINMEEVG